MRFTILIALTCLGTVLAGCGDQSGDDPPSRELPAASTNRETRVSPLPESGRSAADLPDADRTAAQAAISRTLDEWELKLAGLRDKAGKLGEEARVEAGNQLTALDERFVEAGACFKELKEAGSDQWTTVRTKLESLLAELDRACGAAKEKLP